MTTYSRGQTAPRCLSFKQPATAPCCRGVAVAMALPALLLLVFGFWWLGVL